MTDDNLQHGPDLERAVEEHIAITRTARYFTHGPRQGNAREILFVLHGYGQPADGFLESFRGLDNGRRLIVAPEGLSRFYPKGANGGVGASWMTKIDRLLEIEEYIDYLDAVRARVEISLPPGLPVTILGFSQGGATAARWGMLGAKPADRVIVWGSLLPPDLDFDNARLRRMALTLVHGRRDPLVGAERVHSERQRMECAGLVHEWIEFDGAHSIEPTVLANLF